jgi:hypothetical protein
MNRDRPELIKHRHLERKAVVYMRQSTGRQVVENEGSTVYQRAQAEHARRWGFLLVEINDEDLGVSGRSIEMRPGYQRMFAEISRGEVGMLLFSALTRAGRDAVALLLLTKVCAATDTLISEDGRVYDMRDPAVSWSRVCVGRSAMPTAPRSLVSRNREDHDHCISRPLRRYRRKVSSRESLRIGPSTMVISDMVILGMVISDS